MACPDPIRFPFDAQAGVQNPWIVDLFRAYIRWLQTDESSSEEEIDDAESDCSEVEEGDVWSDDE